MSMTIPVALVLVLALSTSGVRVEMKQGGLVSAVTTGCASAMEAMLKGYFPAEKKPDDPPPEFFLEVVQLYADNYCQQGGDATTVDVMIKNVIAGEGATDNARMRLYCTMCVVAQCLVDPDDVKSCAGAGNLPQSCNAKPQCPPKQ
mmetsp:Transcript_71027/g.123193  ORF Transcript_71027/g.123193 Transcript_71027/m.123193 type:complete len:146 (-) Transcript_71027:14-451(-)